LEKSATLFRPKLIVAGASAYARLYDYARIRKVTSLRLISSNKLSCITVYWFLADVMVLRNQGYMFLVFDRSVTNRKLYCWQIWHILVGWLQLVSSHHLLSMQILWRGAMIFFRKGLKEINKQGKEVSFVEKSHYLLFPCQIQFYLLSSFLGLFLI
jgi:glycine hydroxymethyltransferase